MIKAGIFGNQYLKSWSLRPDDAVLLAPAYTFLLGNFPVDYQFWLNIGSRGWYERIYQPLTNPYVINRDWDTENMWTDSNELDLNISNLSKITTGLIRRCKTQVYLTLTERDEQGFEQKGLLVQALNHLLLSSPDPNP
jgi:hypothetical protein